MRRWWYRRWLVVFMIFGTILGTGFSVEQLQAKEEESLVSQGRVEKRMLIPGGMAIGIYMETDGVLVLDTDSITCIDGNEYEPAKNIVKAGDYIVGMNGEEISDKSELIQAVSKLQASQVILKLRRNDEIIQVKMKSVEVERDRYKLGIWVKDNIQGLGTVTYLETNGKFGALGHGIHDSDTEDLIEISNGAVYETKLVGIQKGEKGEPGGLEGIIIYNRYNKKGTITKNTNNGIYGELSNAEDIIENEEPMEICEKEDIELGNATIRCMLKDRVEEYDIKIKNVDSYTGDVNKGIIIEITDERLLDKTGGIVQGMSGSPILQNGKIVGAVTHVLVNDPARGYGIFIENMLDAAE